MDFEEIVGVLNCAQRNSFIVTVTVRSGKEISGKLTAVGKNWLQITSNPESPPSHVPVTAIDCLIAP